MEHLAIMKKSWGLTRKILSGEKRIESRWYRSKYPPWDKIKAGDVVYFKDSGRPVTIKSEVGNVLQFSELDRRKVKGILEEYAELDGIDREDVPKFFEMFKDKRYCVLVFLRNVHGIKPFDVDKSGFGAMSSWITLENIEGIKK